ncbi:MAG TPA: hydroxymethylglutaryl-CoA lyase [Gaiella sp.]|jgi:hydroxymethylglutaryl-CoA lyase/(R)-citramalyl-CoA lyase
MSALELCDVAPRDGLQSLDLVVPPETRAELAGRLAAAGMPRVEVASFVRDDRVPAMAGAEEVVAALPAQGPTTWAGLVLNERGYERLAATRLPEAHVTFAVTETFQERNAGSSVEEGIRRALVVAERARADGRRVTATVSCAFGCPYEGEVDPGVVHDAAARTAAGGVDEIVLADTIGVAGPSAVGALVTRLVRDVGVATGVHLHDTRGTALACLVAALASGATVVDGSVGGIGGCPFAPGAQGNVATEDVVYLLEREGVRTGVDVDALIETARWLSSVLDRPLPGRVQRAGRWP